MEGLYLYGIVGFPPELSGGIRGFGEHPVYLLPRAELAAVVSRSPLSSWPVDEAHLALHEAVVEEIMASRPILPVRFNTFLPGEEAVTALLTERALSFRSALERVGGKVEMGLRVLWEPPSELELSADQEIPGKGPGAEYLQKKLKAERRTAGLRGAGERPIQELQALLRPLAAETWVRRFPTHRLLFTATYLVERDRVQAFREGVAKARDAFSRLSFLLTGPWPPYHFVNGAHDGTTDTLGA